jgi:hypothetical protein
MCVGDSQNWSESDQQMIAQILVAFPVAILVSATVTTAVFAIVRYLWTLLGTVLPENANSLPKFRTVCFRLTIFRRGGTSPEKLPDGS